MKKRLIFILLSVSAFCIILASCGDITEKVSQSDFTVEIGSTFNINKMFTCEDGITIALKEGEIIDTRQLGETSAVFVISNGKKSEEKSFTFNVVDSKAPIIEAQDVSLYKGEDFIPENYASCTDNSGGTISISVESSTVDTSIEGRYSVTYTASDSSGNVSKKDISVTVLPLDTAEAVMDKIDQYLSQNDYTLFKYNKNRYDAVFITAPSLGLTTIDSSRKVRMYPEIYINQDIFTGSYKVVGIIFRFEFIDSTEPLSDRYVLYANDLTISSSTDSYKIIFSGIPSGSEIERYEYVSKFDYTLNASAFTTLHTILDGGEITFDVNTENEHTVVDVETFEISSVDEPYHFVYTVESEATLSLLNSTLDIAEHFADLLGK